ncbi:hypothetical protein HPB58_23420 [Priestia filamentosa]|uniref:hypothetical protein n=1 Tax=Priestia TaxID=2800373 RepID=UPI001FB437DE|nr:hypothetical protein [Priestia filamentosa]MED3727908.1 hypothetical protein [Priestia filamentosa]UOE60218.1 hypothetical protein HPB58_23420 [Priestia filamentosa]
MNLLSLNPSELESAASILKKEASSLQNLRQDLKTLLDQDHSWKTSSRKEFDETSRTLLKTIDNKTDEINDKSTYLENLAEQARLAQAKEKLKQEKA